MEQWNNKGRQDLFRKQGLAPKKKPRQHGCGGASSSSKTRGSGSRTEELQSGSGKKEAEAREDEDDDPETEGSYKTWIFFEQSEEAESTEENSELAYGKAASAKTELDDDEDLALAEEAEEEGKVTTSEEAEESFIFSWGPHEGVNPSSEESQTRVSGSQQV